MKTQRKAIKRRSNCPVTYTLDIIGDRWAVLIIRDIIFFDKSAFGDFAKSQEGIATNILTDRLKRLEEQDVLLKKTDEKNQKKFIYSLTQKGLDLLPVIVEMILFSEKHDPETAVTKSKLDEIKINKEKFIKALQEKHRSLL